MEKSKDKNCILQSQDTERKGRIKGSGWLHLLSKNLIELSEEFWVFKEYVLGRRSGEILMHNIIYLRLADSKLAGLYMTKELYL